MPTLNNGAMRAALKTRTAFVILALVGSPALVYAAVWALDGLGLDTTQFSLALYAALIVGPPVLFILGLGRVTARTPKEVAAVMVAAVGVTGVLALIVVTWALSRASLN
jgi:hypothetical protein